MCFFLLRIIFTFRKSILCHCFCWIIHYNVKDFSGKLHLTENLFAHMCSGDIGFYMESIE